MFFLCQRFNSWLCFGSRIDFPFADNFGDDLDAEVFDNCILSVHADNSFTIPAQSEVVVVGRLSSMPKGVNTSAGEIYGLVTPKSDLPHR